MCFGKDLATNRIVNIGEAVGIIAAQSIGEPGTQLTMRTFHTGGVAGVEDITGGFARLIELIDAHEQPWGRPAVISPYEGKVIKIEEDPENNNHFMIYIENKTSDGYIQSEKVFVNSNKKLRVNVGDYVRIGQKLSEGPIIIKELLELTDTITTQNYLLKEIQKIYRTQGISISDKYIEIIIRQMMSKIIITIPGDSKFFAGAIVDIFDYQEENSNLLSKGMIPAYGEIVIKGAKQVPLLSNSFLSAASYQETSKILVHSAISSRNDDLLGLKENIIIGKKIPAGTALYPFEANSKYDIKPSIQYFDANYDNENIDSNLPAAQISDEEFAENLKSVIGEEYNVNENNDVIETDDTNDASEFDDNN